MVTRLKEVAASADAVPAWQGCLQQNLMNAKTVDEAGLARAERVQRETGERLDRILSRLGIVSERDMAETLAATLDLPFIAEDAFPEYPLFPEEIVAKFVKHAQVLPVGEDEAGVRLAMADPLDTATADAVSLRLGRPVERCVAVGSALENALERLYSAGKSSIDTLAESLDEEPGEATDADVARLRDIANDAPVIRIVNLLMRKAVESGASDIHIEPFEARLRIRFRIDGLLQDVDAPPLRLHAAILSRIKIMAKLNIAERRLPQDGRIKVIIGGNEIDLRIATTPTLHGEGVVLRILDRESLTLDFAALGFSGDTLEAFRALLAKPNGIVLVTGPTGSGKTTTLYTALEELNSAERKIIAVEDPVEYQIDGVNQIQARPKIGLTFASALRSILRQDPDVIMIGEIRDLETARIAVQAALTGHLVLATLHTNTAAAAVNRLLDMGVEDYLLASTLNGVLAQRLVRRLCPLCRTEQAVLPDLLAHLGDGAVGDARFFSVNGCDACNGRGIRGRSALVELLTMDDRLRSRVLARADATALQVEAIEAGMKTMRMHGIEKAMAGECTLEEVMRVTNTA